MAKKKKKKNIENLFRNRKFHFLISFVCVVLGFTIYLSYHKISNVMLDKMKNYEIKDVSGIIKKIDIERHEKEVYCGDGPDCNTGFRFSGYYYTFDATVNYENNDYKFFIDYSETEKTDYYIGQEIDFILKKENNNSFSAYIHRHSLYATETEFYSFIFLVGFVVLLIGLYWFPMQIIRISHKKSKKMKYAFWIITAISFFLTIGALGSSGNEISNLNEFMVTENIDYGFIAWYFVLLIIQFGVALLYSEKDNNTYYK